MPKGIRKSGIRGTCERAKQTKMSFGTKPREMAKKSLEHIHTDVLRPIECVGNQAEKGHHVMYFNRKYGFPLQLRSAGTQIILCNTYPHPPAREPHGPG